MSLLKLDDLIKRGLSIVGNWLNKFVGNIYLVAVFIDHNKTLKPWVLGEIIYNSIVNNFYRNFILRISQPPVNIYEFWHEFLKTLFTSVSFVRVTRTAKVEKQNKHITSFGQKIPRLYEVISKFCDLGGRPYLLNKCSPCLCLPPV